MGPNFNRRKLLGIVAGTTALVASRAEARTVAREIPWTAGDANRSGACIGRRLRVPIARPSRVSRGGGGEAHSCDELGPGAKEAGASSSSIASSKGRMARRELVHAAGPGPTGTESQGYQSRMTPAQLYRVAIKTSTIIAATSTAVRLLRSSRREQQDQVLEAA